MYFMNCLLCGVRERFALRLASFLASLLMPFILPPLIAVSCLVILAQRELSFT